MDLRQLRHFIAVVELGSFSRAADRVCLTQPALTRSIKTLEGTVGTLLLDRRTSGVVPTAAGRALYEHARFMMTESERALGEARLAAEGVSGELSIGMGPYFAEHRFAGALAAFARAHDRTAITVVEGMVEELVPQLLDGALDLALCIVPAASMQRGLRFERLGATEGHIFAAAGHPLAQRPAVAKAELRRFPWAALDRPHMRDFLSRYFATGGDDMPPDIIWTSSMPLMRTLAAEEGLLALLPADLMRGTATVALPAPDMPVVRKAGLIYRAGSPPRPIVDAFAAAVHAAFGTERPDVVGAP